MPNARQTFSYSTNDVTLQFPVLRGEHVRVWSNGVEKTINVDFTITGPQAEWGGINEPVLSFSSNPGAGAAIVVVRDTPTDLDNRVVNFTDSSVVTGEILDSSAIQSYFAIQELEDKIDNDSASLSYPTESVLSVGSRRLTELAAPLEVGDAARLGDLQAYGLASLVGLPIVTGANNGNVLMVSSGSWSATVPATARTNLGLGTAATYTVGSGGMNLPTVNDADARFSRRSLNLSDLSSVATARTNLGLTSTATATTGTAANNVVALDGSARLPAVDGRNLNLDAHKVYGRNGGMLDVLYSAKFAPTATSTHPMLTLDTSTAWKDFEYNSAANHLTFSNVVSVNNGSTDVASDLSRSFTLKTSATSAYIVTVNLVFSLASATAQEFAVAIASSKTSWRELILAPVTYNVTPPTTASSLADANASGGGVIGAADRAGTVSVSFTRLLTGTTSSTTDKFAIVACRNSATNPGVFLHYGDILIQKVQD